MALLLLGIGIKWLTGVDQGQLERVAEEWQGGRRP